MLPDVVPALVFTDTNLNLIRFMKLSKLMLSLLVLGLAGTLSAQKKYPVELTLQKGARASAVIATSLSQQGTVGGQEFVNAQMVTQNHFTFTVTRAEGMVYDLEVVIDSIANEATVNGQKQTMHSSSNKELAAVCGKKAIVTVNSDFSQVGEPRAAEGELNEDVAAAVRNLIGCMAFYYPAHTDSGESKKHAGLPEGGTFTASTQNISLHLVQDAQMISKSGGETTLMKVADDAYNLLANYQIEASMEGFPMSGMMNSSYTIDRSYGLPSALTTAALSGTQNTPQGAVELHMNMIESFSIK